MGDAGGLDAGEDCLFGLRCCGGEVASGGGGEDAMFERWWHWGGCRGGRLVEINLWDELQFRKYPAQALYCAIISIINGICRFD